MSFETDRAIHPIDQCCQKKNKGSEERFWQKAHEVWRPEETMG